MADHHPNDIHQILYDATNPMLCATICLSPGSLLATLTLADKDQQVTWQIDAHAAVALGGVLTELLTRASTPPAHA